MPVLVDGNNLLHRLAGATSRGDIRRLTLDLVRRESAVVTVVFDGPPPPGAPNRESLGKVTIVYSGSASADDLIIRTIPTGAQAATWVVVTDDRQLATRARHRGAKVRPLHQWRDKLSRRVKPSTREQKLSAAEVEEWQRYFESGGKT